MFERTDTHSFRNNDTLGALVPVGRKNGGNAERAAANRGWQKPPLTGKKSAKGRVGRDRKG